MSKYTYIPLSALSIWLSAPVEKAKPFFIEHRESFEGDFGAEQASNLERAIDGDLEAAKKFAEALVPGATFALSRNAKDEFVCNYALATPEISGRLTSVHGGDARNLLGAAISIWDHLRRQG